VLSDVHKVCGVFSWSFFTFFSLIFEARRSFLDQGVRLPGSNLKFQTLITFWASHFISSLAKLSPYRRVTFSVPFKNGT
jgi:hypothetical protein